jgi:8-oxo-dGTP diphosphatase
MDSVRITLSLVLKIHDVNSMSYAYPYPRPNLAVDCVVFGLDEPNQLQVMLIRRGLPPFQNQWALPGGFVHVDESVDQAARRELWEETGLQEVFLEQLYTFGAVDRDPRERVVTVAYYALVNLREHAVRAMTDAAEAAWFPIADLPSLAFDHDQIIAAAIARLKGKVRYEPIGFELLPKKFTLSQLQTLYETVLEMPLDKRNFRKKILKMDLLIELSKYRQLKDQRFNFEI